MFVLIGCTNVSTNKSHHSILNGVPLLLSTYYSATQVTPDLALTTKHSGGEFVRKSIRYDAMLIPSTKGVVPKFANPVLNEIVLVYGTGMGGEESLYVTKVIDIDIWACGGPIIPKVHIIKGVCIEMGKGYTYGFAVDRKEISSGFSGGGAYNKDGELLGIVVQTGTDTSGRDIAFLYFIDDLRNDLGF